MANIVVKTSEPSVCELTETKARIFTSHLTQYYGTLALIFITAQHFLPLEQTKAQKYQ